MTVPVLVHRFFAKYNSAWAYHPRLESIYSVLRNTLKEEVQGDPGSVGPVGVPGRRLMLVGMRSADPDRPTDEFGRTLVVLRIAVLPADQADGVEETRRLLDALPLPDVPGPSESLGVEGTGPEPSDFDRVVSPEPAPNNGVENPGQSRSWLKVAVMGFGVVIAVVIGIPYFLSPGEPGPTPPPQPPPHREQPISRVNLEALEIRLREFSTGWGDLVDTLGGTETDYQPLMREKPQDVADLLEGKAKEWVRQLKPDESAEGQLAEGQEKLAKLETAWRKAKADEKYLEPVRTVIHDARLRVRYEAVRAAVTSLARELESGSQKPNGAAVEINKSYNDLRICLVRASECDPTGSINEHLVLARKWYKLLDDSSRWKLQVKAGSPRMTVTKVYITSPSTRPLSKSILLERAGSEGRFKLPDIHEIPFTATDIEFEVQCRNLTNQSFKTGPIPWRVGGPLAKGVVTENGTKTEIEVGCPESDPPKLPDFETAKKGSKEPRNSAPDSAPRGSLKPNVLPPESRDRRNTN